jgi:hypothetical protein
MALLKTVHHISLKLNEIISINCPVCGCAHMEADKEGGGFHDWTCQNGHHFYVSIYESSAKALNIAFLMRNRAEEQ